ncbi:hypothetical protein AB0C29_09055 [Actinoplanes sp. NPDC048791]|uniref:hypothetical protein n=1 Tax=Actinoplanes sp. NPDC048791 TaxID=3154623 RepID=UPI00340DDA7E
MSAVRVFETKEYRPEYGLLLLVDNCVAWDAAEDPVVPHHRDRGDTPTGTFAGSGAGWLAAQADDLAPHAIRLELHDGPSPEDRTAFDDVLETPFRSSSGGLTLATLTSGYGAAHFNLGDAEWFRTRVARWRADIEGQRGYRWLISFWPVAMVEPPVRLARRREATELEPINVARDVESVLRWTPELPVRTTMTSLAQRLLLGETALRDGLASAADKGLLHVDDRAELRLWLGRRTTS